MPREDRDDDLGNHRVLVADDAGEERLVGFHRGEEVVAEFVLDGFRLPAAFAELLECGRSRCVTEPPSSTSVLPHSRPKGAVEPNRAYSLFASQPCQNRVMIGTKNRAAPGSNGSDSTICTILGESYVLVSTPGPRARPCRSCRCRLAQEKIDNPEFASWSKFKKGTSVTLKSTSGVQQDLQRDPHHFHAGRGRGRQARDRDDERRQVQRDGDQGPADEARCDQDGQAPEGREEGGLRCRQAGGNDGRGDRDAQGRGRRGEGEVVQVQSRRGRRRRPKPKIVDLRRRARDDGEDAK